MDSLLRLIQRLRMASTSNESDRRASEQADGRRPSEYPKDFSTPEIEEKLLRFRLSVGSEFIRAGNEAACRFSS